MKKNIYCLKIQSDINLSINVLLHSLKTGEEVESITADNGYLFILTKTNPPQSLNG